MFAYHRTGIILSRWVIPGQKRSCPIIRNNSDVHLVYRDAQERPHLYPDFTEIMPPDSCYYGLHAADAGTCLLRRIHHNTCLPDEVMYNELARRSGCAWMYVPKSDLIYVQLA